MDENNADGSGTYPDLFVLVDGDPVPVVESDNGVLITAEDVYVHSYTDAHELLKQIAEDPKVWTKKKIMYAVAEYLKAAS